MTPKERNTIISEEYADFLAEYRRDNSPLINFPNGTINYINDTYAVVHIPVENMTPDSISIFDYYSIPSCFGLETIDDTIPEYRRYTPTPISSTSNLKGKGVLVGFVDTGVDYRNPVFQNADGTSRIVAIWDQTIQSDSYPKDFYYGTEYLKDTINEALNSSDPLSVVPSMDTIGHGTMLAGLCAGTPNEDFNFSGIATEAEFVIVKLKEAKSYLRRFFEIPEGAICYQENDIIMGIKYLHYVANILERPLVICLALGSSQTNHAGNRIIARYLNSIALEASRCVVVSGGNEGNRGNHYYGDIIAPLTTDDVFLHVGEDDSGFTLQFWGTSPNRFWIDVHAPDGNFISRISPVSGTTIKVPYNDTTLIIDTQIKGAITAEQFVIMRFNKPISGVWHLLVYSDAGDIPMQFHFWLPIHNFLHPDTYFIKPNTYTTITSPGNSPYFITTTSYDQGDQSLYFYNSRGFTATNLPKPDLVAPGVNLLCPFLDNTFVYGTGSSLSAAYTSGISALLMEWGIVRNNLPQLNTGLLKKAFTQSALRQPELEYPNPDWGYGIIDISRIETALNEIITL